MRKTIALVLGLVLAPGLALAAIPAHGPQTEHVLGEPVGGLAASADRPTEVQVAVARQVLGAGESLPEHSQPYLRYLYVLSGQLKVSDLSTGEDQVVGAGAMATEVPKDLHVAVAMGKEPAVFVIVDQKPDGEVTDGAGQP